jgi:hypothetical protein
VANHKQVARLSLSADLDELCFNVVKLGPLRDHTLELFGPPHYSAVEDKVAGEVDYWGFEYSCGLRVVCAFDREQGNGRVLADMPEIDHVIRHLPFPRHRLQSQSVSFIQAQIEAASQHKNSRCQQIADRGLYQVWRQGDDGNAMPVGQPTTERAANCWVAELESHGHKQIYWASTVR